MTATPPSSSPTRQSGRPSRRRPSVEPTNVLIVVLPPPLFDQPHLLESFCSHFESYGSLWSWTPLPRLGRVLAVYEDSEAALEARGEMDGFVWDDENEPGPSRRESRVRSVIRVYFGPAYTPTQNTELQVPDLGKNFLISPPGSPPVGWEQIIEDPPNRHVFPTNADGDVVDEDDKWVQELERALRYLSVQSGGDEAEEEQAEKDDKDTLTVVPPIDDGRPGITISTPTEGLSRSYLDSSGSGNASPTAQRSLPHNITSVKATVDSFRITPTGRPPLASLDDYQHG